MSSLEHEIASLFGDVLLYASELGLVGKEHFAVDGCKLPSNASKKWSGTHKELEEKHKKLERVAERIVQRHRERDGQEAKTDGPCREPEKANYYRRKVAEIKAFLETHQQKRGPTGSEQKSNLTDPESAKMSTSRAVIQGYNGLAVVDDHAQTVVHAEAHGTGYEAHLLAPLIESTRQSFSELVTLQDFLYDEANARCICPAGQQLYRAGQDMLFNGYRVARFKAPKTACRECPLRHQCLRHPDRTPQRQLTIIKHQEGPAPMRRSKCNDAAKRMRLKFDTPRGREIYSRRMVLRPFLGVMGTIEPVFANLQNKGMRRFTLRGQKKVSAQWKLFTMVHNIEKVAGVTMR